MPAAAEIDTLTIGMPMRAAFLPVAIATLLAALAATPASAQRFPYQMSPAQLVPIPPDPAELATGETHVPATPQERASLVALLEKAQVNHQMHARGGAPYNLQVSFTIAPSTLYQGGAGVLQESWVSGRNWRWSAVSGDYSNVQIASGGVVYGQNRAPLPLHFKLLRDAIFAPAGMAGRQMTLRTVNATWQGAAVTCILLSATRAQDTAAQGRQWYETEYCLNPQSGAIQIWSEAPGIYAIYNYANALSFHGRTLPGSITITENGKTVAEAQLTSITDADPSNLSLYTPTSQMESEGPAMVGELPQRFPLMQFDAQSAPGQQPAMVQPTIIHVTIDARGKVLESEALQTSAVSERALTAVLQAEFGVSAQPAQSSPVLREAFINVQFRPAPAMANGGQPN